MSKKRRRKAKITGRANLKHDASTIAASLRSREGWKYAVLKKYLDNLGEPHKFEYVPSGARCIYDLALLSRKLLLEFDGSYHKPKKQKIEDAKKERTAKRLGWILCRIPVRDNEVIHPESICHLFRR